MWFTRNDLANNLCIVLSVAEPRQHLFVPGVRAVYGFALATKESRQNHIATSHCPKAGQSPCRLLPLKFWTVNIESLSRNCHDRVQAIIPPSLGSCYFAEVSAWELTAECHGLLRRVVLLLPRRNSMLRCAVPLDGVSCCTIALFGHNSFSYWSTFRFFSLRHLSCNSIKTRRNSIHQPTYSDIMTELTH